MLKKRTLLQWSGKFFYVYRLLIKNRSCLTAKTEIIIIIIISNKDKVQLSMGIHSKISFSMRSGLRSNST